MKIFDIHEKKEERFLRRQTKPFDFSSMGRKEITDLLIRMKRTMREANGIGLSANQVGLDCKAFVAQVPDHQGAQKFYALFNPRIEKMGEEQATAEEGCLSVHGVYGRVPRAKQIVIRGLDRNGKPLRIKAWGLLARVFQHEVDHLEGKLFIDRAKELYRVPTSERLKQREDA